MPVNVVSIPNVPLLHCGEHNASTGPWTVTPEDLRSIVDAHTAGIAAPVLHAGHQGPLRDAAPALAAGLGMHWAPGNLGPGAPAPYTPQEEAQVAERLRALGYLE